MASADAVPLWGGGLLVDWPYGALVLAVLLLWLWTRRSGGRLGGSEFSVQPRWRDPSWLLPMVWPIYLLHQFEEHGIDLQGERFAFLASLCESLGFTGGEPCPANPELLFAVNVVGCQVAFALAWVYRFRRPLVAACVWGIPVVNALLHIKVALQDGGYNPGLFTAVVLFLPLSAWVFWICIRAEVIRFQDLTRIFATGLGVHAVLVGTIFLRAEGLLSETALLAVNGLNGLLPLPFGTLGVRRRLQPSGPPGSARIH